MKKSRSEATSARVAAVAARLVKIKQKDLRSFYYTGNGDGCGKRDRFRTGAGYVIGVRGSCYIVRALLRDIRLVAASALTQRPDRKQTRKQTRKRK